MSKYDELKRLAEAECISSELGSFENPQLCAAILDLLAENERNQRMLLAACMDMGAIGEALGADMNSDGEELLSMVVDMKAQNERLREFLLHISKTSGDKGAVMGARELLKEFGA